MGVANALNISKIGLVLFDGNSIFNSGATVPGTQNIGVSYSAGTFTITDAVGGALSSSNPALATFQNNSSLGRLITLTITAPYTFTDAAGTNEIGANLFGITTGIAWALDVPFYLYAIIASAQNDVSFGISRIPHLTLTPVAGKLAVSGTTAATTQGSLFLMKKSGSTPTVANFAEQPCVCIGSFRMQATLTPAWTVQALNASKDGVMNFNEGTTFYFPQAQHGASAGTWMLPNGGTAPTFTSSATAGYPYYVKTNGFCQIAPFLTGDGGTAGAGAVNSQLAMPFKLDSTGPGSAYGCFFMVSAAIAQSGTPIVNAGADIIAAFAVTSNSGIFYTNGAFLAGARTVEGTITYQMDKL